MSAKIHGLRGSRTYRIYRNMRSRCDNPKFTSYPHYGGRGIGYCTSWATFEGFLSDMGEAPAGMTLERKQNHLGYCKTNCEWATLMDQANNKRNTPMLTAFGRTQSLMDWSRELCLRPARIRMRLRRGGSHEHALTTGEMNVR